jgi:hypothetical protein
MMTLATSHDKALRPALAAIDSLMLSIGFALAASAPGPAGEAGAIAAISFDLKQRCWYGVLLSAASMVPVIGYAPALFKVGWLISTLNRRLKAIEETLPEVQGSPENVELLRSSLRKYYRRLPKIGVTQSLRARLARIMAIDDSDSSADGEVSGSQFIAISKQTGDPE